MDEIQEEKLLLNKRIEQLITEHEKNEAMAALAVESTQKNRTSIGPANDLLRFLYILEQQYLDDDEDVRRKAREDLLDYMDQFRLDDVDEKEPVEVLNEPQSEQPADVTQPTATTPLNLPPPTPVSQPAFVVPTPVSQPAFVVPTPVSQPAFVVPTPVSQPAFVVPTPVSQPVFAVPPPSSPSSTEAKTNTCAALMPPITEWAHITPYTLERFQKLSAEAEQYQDRYRLVDSKRAQQLVAPIRITLNKLRPETLATLTKDTLDYLNGKEQKVASITFRISNDEERLLCLSTLADSILRQLLGGDLNDVKTDILLPFIRSLTGDERFKEFRTIFLYHLHKKCPYTVPLYPRRLATMNDDDYRRAMGYEEKKEDGQVRLETEDEFLNRMNGLVRLFCKLATNRIPPFDQDLYFGWEWCSNVLNLPPQPDLTALLLRVFLQEAGRIMKDAYPNDFPLILRTIRKNLPTLCKDTSPSEKARLEKALEDVFKGSN